jgi:hypothetical protein
MTVTSKPMGVAASPLTTTLGAPVGTPDLKLNTAQAQLVRASAASVSLQTTAAVGKPALTPYQASTSSYQTTRQPTDCWKVPVGPSKPNPYESTHPAGSLKVDNGVITTPGGYKIEQLAQFDWKISGPDGKETKIWGDPHVAEGDGGTWDFKRDSTFVLGDGTRINVTTKPYGNDMTVTGGLEVISGNDRVQVTDIDKGKGKVGQVTQDGFQHVNSFGGKDVFVMGKETDDWSFTGKEIVGSNNGGESFKLGNDLATGTPTTTPQQPGNPLGQVLKQMSDLFKGLSDLFNGMFKLMDTFSKFNQHDGGLTARPGPEDYSTRRQDRLRRDFDSIGRMIQLFKGLEDLTKAVQPYRNNFMA